MRAAVILVLLLPLLLAPTVLGDVSDPRAAEQWARQMIRADEAYDTGIRGQGVVVAVLDTGIDETHPDLAGNLWRNPAECGGTPSVDDDSNGFADDCYGYDFVDDDGTPEDTDSHGTHVSGIVAAVADNGEGVAGIAPEAKIMALKVLADVNATWWGTEEAIDYARENGADIISMSWGVDSFPLPYGVEMAIRRAHDAGILLVAAAGNNDTDRPHYPAAYDEVVAVASTTRLDQRAQFSNYGPWVELAAPGGGGGSTILSTIPGGYSFLSGTSMAAPHVSGVAALVKSRSGLPGEEIRKILQETAVDLGDVGKDSTFGYGRVDAMAAVEATPDDDVPPSVLVTSHVEGDAVTGIVPLQMEAVDNLLVERVEVYVDGTFAASVSGPPYVHQWDTTAYSNGLHWVRAVAYDLAGNQGEQVRGLIVQNPGGLNGRPSCRVLSHDSGDSVNLPVNISGESWDSDGNVQFVEVQVGDGPWHKATGETPWTYTWGSWEPGNVSVSCRAYDGDSYSEVAIADLVVKRSTIPAFLYEGRGTLAVSLVAALSLLALALGVTVWRRGGGRE